MYREESFKVLFSISIPPLFPINSTYQILITNYVISGKKVKYFE